MAFDASGKLEDLATALSALQGELPPVLAHGKGKTGAGGSREYRYATLQDVWTTVQPLLVKHGLSVVQMPCSAPLSFGESNANVGVSTVLLHKSGSYFSSTLWLPLSQVTAQGAGSAITYARRYALCAVLGVVADEDDDAAQASSARRARAVPSTPADMRTTAAEDPGAAIPSPQGTAVTQPAAPRVTQAQIKRMFTIATNHGWQLHETKALVARHGFESSKDITRAAYDVICQALEDGVVPDAPATGEVVE